MLLERLRATASDLSGLDEELNASTVSDRLKFLHSLSKEDLRKLFHLSSNPPLLSFFADSTSPVAFQGKNSMPIFNHFEKRFRCIGKSVVGYNHQNFSWVTGPGYFSVESSGVDTWFDYRTPVPFGGDGWPLARTNESGLARVVYGGMTDVVRKVSSDVVVGRASRHGKTLDVYFALCRL